MEEDDDDDRAFAHVEYWNNLYRQHALAGDAATFDAYRDFDALHAEFARVLGHASVVWHFGNGTSRVPLLAAERSGSQRHVAVDASEAATALMAERCAHERVRYATLDCTALASVPSDSLEAVFDKGTLDALVYDAEKATAYVCELHRVLRPGAVVLLVAVNFLPNDPLSVEHFLARVPWAAVERSTLPASHNDPTPQYAFVLRK